MHYYTTLHWAGRRCWSYLLKFFIPLVLGALGIGVLFKDLGTPVGALKPSSFISGRAVTLRVLTYCAVGTL